ncbi:MAG: hypothetical protein Tsb0021_15200 [Chlamydiales bacterium]
MIKSTFFDPISVKKPEEAVSYFYDSDKLNIIREAIKRRFRVLNLPGNYIKASKEKKYSVNLEKSQEKKIYLFILESLSQKFGMPISYPDWIKIGMEFIKVNLSLRIKAAKESQQNLEGMLNTIKEETFEDLLKSPLGLRHYFQNLSIYFFVQQVLKDEELYKKKEAFNDSLSHRVQLLLQSAVNLDLQKFLKESWEVINDKEGVGEDLLKIMSPSPSFFKECLENFIDSEKGFKQSINLIASEILDQEKTADTIREVRKELEGILEKRYVTYKEFRPQLASANGNEVFKARYDENKKIDSRKSFPIFYNGQPIFQNVKSLYINEFIKKITANFPDKFRKVCLDSSSLPVYLYHFNEKLLKENPGLAYMGLLSHQTFEVIEKAIRENFFPKMFANTNTSWRMHHDISKTLLDFILLKEKSQKVLIKASFVIRYKDTPVDLENYPHPFREDEFIDFHPQPKIVEKGFILESKDERKDDETSCSDSEDLSEESNRKMTDAPHVIAIMDTETLFTLNKHFLFSGEIKVTKIDFSTTANLNEIKSLRDQMITDLNDQHKHLKFSQNSFVFQTHTKK